VDLSQKKIGLPFRIGGAILSVLILWAGVHSITTFYGTEHMLEFTLLGLMMLYYSFYAAFIVVTGRYSFRKNQS